MKPEDLGYNADLEKYRTDNSLSAFEAGRIIAEHKERYIVKTDRGEYEAEITGNMRFTASRREDYPAVGDWVAITVYDTDMAVIHSLFPRYSVIRRQEAGKAGEEQIIAANIDYAFLVQAAGSDFSINRLERYLTICYSSGIKPIILLTKSDLVGEPESSLLVESIRQRISNVTVMAISNVTGKGLDDLLMMIEKGKTYCMLGSSGAGKSTLINSLSGRSVMKTGNISLSTNKGRHITTHREMIFLDNGGIVIDNPGMKEVGITDAAGGLEVTFDSLLSLAVRCRYSDCTHINEDGCAVIEAIDKGLLSRESYNNFLRLEREKRHYESTVEERRRKDRSFGKMLKSYKKDLKRKGDT